MRKLALVPLLLLTICLSGCGVVDYYFLPVAEDTVQEIFEAGNSAMEDKDYGKAIEYFSRIKDEFPFSNYAIEAELSLGDAYFLRQNYMEAAEAYRDFESMHPRHEAIPYVLFQLASALKNSYTSVDHTATEVAEAMELYQRIEQMYPNTEYAEKCPEAINQCRRMLAEREIFIADVYWGMGNYQAAWTRYKNVTEQYADIDDVATYARKQGEVSYLRYRENSAEALREEREGSWKQYFKWL